MNVEVHHRGARDAVFALRIARGDRSAVEEAEPHRLRCLGMVARRPGADKRVGSGVGHYRIDGGDSAAGSAKGGFQRARRHRGIAVEIDHSFLGRDVPQLVDVFVAVAQRDDIEIGHRRLMPDQRVKPLVRKTLLDGAQAIRPFRMTRSGDMIEAGGGVIIECRHCGSIFPLSGLSKLIRLSSCVRRMR